MSSTQTPNMNLTVPGVGTEPSPEWAQEINSDLSILDQHNHSPGQGVQITPSGIDISSDLTFQGNAATNLEYVLFSVQTGDPASNYVEYVKGVDLYYTDGNGNHIQITSGGGVNGSPGSISNLTSPASASYVSATQTFVWKSGVSTAANMDAASLIVRYPGSYPTPTGNYIAIEAPSSLSTGFALTLPAALPSVTSNLTLSNSGVIGTSTPPASVVISSSSAMFSTTSVTYVPVTNLSVAITTSGGPVMLMLQPENAISSVAKIGLSSTTENPAGTVLITRYDGSSTTNISQTQLFSSPIGGAGSSSCIIYYTPGSISFIDVPTAGTYTYAINVVAQNSTTITCTNIVLAAYEI